MNGRDGGYSSSQQGGFTSSVQDNAGFSSYQSSQPSSQPYCPPQQPVYLASNPHTFYSNPHQSRRNYSDGYTSSVGNGCCNLL